VREGGVEGADKDDYISEGERRFAGFIHFVCLRHPGTDSAYWAVAGTLPPQLTRLAKAGSAASWRGRAAGLAS
jgi:hypothetical protein